MTATPAAAPAPAAESSQTLRLSEEWRRREAAEPPDAHPGPAR